MMQPSHVAVPQPDRPWRVGCVSYLNARPLVEGLGSQDDIQLRFDVPSHLLASLLDGKADLALCPVIDYFRHQDKLIVVPAGCIASAGQTLTVRLYSRAPLEKITQVHVDSDSHTSVALMQVLLDQLFQLRPTLVQCDMRKQALSGQSLRDLPAMLLIGDKVVTDGPSMLDYPHQMDLGQAWHKLTGLPFVFAVWMAMKDHPLGDLPHRLTSQRDANLPHRHEIARQHASTHRWPEDIARHYLRDLLHYTVSQAERDAMAQFARLAHALGLVPAPQPVVFWDSSRDRP